MIPSTSPYIHTAPPLQKIMLQVIAALLPGVIVLTFWQGSRWLGLLCLAAVCAALFEALALKLRRRALSPLKDGSAIVTGLLLMLSLPVLAPAWLVIIGCALAILLGKHLYGGLGQNPFNPAMVGFALLLVSFPALMSGMPAQSASIFADVDGVSAATILDSSRALKIAGQSLRNIHPPWQQQLLAGAWLLGGVWLAWVRASDWRLLVSSLLGSLLAAVIFWLLDPSAPHPYSQMTTGAIIFGAAFIVTDPVTAATTARGRWIYGFLAGALMILIRHLGNFPDGVAFAVLLANAMQPLIDPLTQPRYKS